MNQFTTSTSPEPTPAGYAMGHLTEVDVTEELLDYISQIEDTMRPFGGTWLVHGTDPDWREGAATGDVVLIRFPDMTAARAWYESEAYQAIVDLRTRNSTASIALLEGVPTGYSAMDTVAKLRAAVAPAGA